MEINPKRTGARRHRWRGAHKRVSEVRWIDVPAQPGVGAHCLAAMKPELAPKEG